MMTLMRYVEVFLAARDVCPAYAKLIRTRCRSLTRFSQRSIRVAELDSAIVNAWLADLQRQKLRPHTIDGHRRNLLVVWRAAIEDGLTDQQPIRIRKIKVPRLIIHAYTADELRRLLHAASQLKGRHRNGNRRAIFWQAMIHSAYSTALRLSDLLLVFRHQIGSDGSASIVQSKTGYIHRVRFSKQALHFAAQLSDANGLLLPWPYRKDAITPRFQAIKRLAGIERGSLKWIRRSAASYAERQQNGAGPRMLGHRGEDVFREYYCDSSIAESLPPMPPEL